MDGVYFEHTQKCYLRITVEASWEEARSKCQLSSNGDLASLSDSYWFLFNNYFDWNFPDYWVGGERVDGDGQMGPNGAMYIGQKDNQMKVNGIMLQCTSIIIILIIYGMMDKN